MQIENDWVILAAENPQFVSYQLTINLDQESNITIGRLGRLKLPAGRYAYTGSACRNLVSRVKRHLSKDKKLRWHIDYLLAAKGTQVVAVDLSTKTECEYNQAVDGIVITPGFGASDCRAGCGSHLKFLGTN